MSQEEKLGPVRRLLYTSYYGDLDGGGELRMLDHIRHSSIPRSSFSVLLLTSGDLCEKLRELGIDVHLIPWSWADGRPRRLLRFPWVQTRVAGLLRRLRPDVMMCNTYLDLQLVATTTSLLGVPIIWRSRAEVFPNLPPTASRRLRRIVGFLNRRVARILPTTRYDANLMIQAGVRENLVRTIYNGVDVGHFQEGATARDRIRSEFRIDPSATVVGFVGRFTRLKGHDTFLKALHEIREPSRPVRALVVGYTAQEPEYEASIRGLVGELGMNDQVIFTGYREDIAELMAAIDIYVLASRRETFGTSVIEAMAAGKPIVATRAPGPCEILEDGETGILVPIDDVKAMGAAVQRLAHDPELAARLGATAARRAREVFDLTASLRAIDDECRTVARAHHARGGPAR